MKNFPTRRLIFVLLLLPAMLHGQSLAPAFERVKPSVVIVRTVQKEQVPAPNGQAAFSAGLGSGVLISQDGKILTAAHVVQTAEYVEVEFSTGESVEGQVVSSTPTADLALVQVARVPRGAAVATLGDSDGVRVGDEVFVVGAPLGVSYTLTVGHLSGRHTAGTLYDGFMLGEFLQTDAAINPGNSGGPMFNMSSEVVGIVSYVLSESGSWAGLGFAVSTNSARRLLLERRQFWTGVEGYLLRGDMAKVFNLPQEAGVLVQRVADKSPAAQFGLRGGSLEANIGGEPLLVGGDIILRVMNVPVSAAGLLDIRERLGNLKAGDTATLTILRGGQQLEMRGLVPAP